jgi:hypothetical protein
MRAYAVRLLRLRRIEFSVHTAVCTPDFFGYNADRKLKYRGRLDEGRTTPPRAGEPRELVEAMRAIATTGLAPADHKASIGCSIKWKDE